MYLQILIAFFFIAYIIIKSKQSFDILRMSFWLYLSYAFLLITHLFSGISYNVGNISRILPYLFICLLLVLLGEKIGLKVKSENAKTFPIKLITLNLLSIIGSSILVFDLFRMNEITFGLRIEDHSASIIGVIGNVLASFGIIAWLASLYDNRMNGRKIPLLSYLSILSYVAGGILSAGRQSVIIITLATLILFIWSAKKNKEIKKIDLNVTTKSTGVPWGMLLLAFIFFCYFFFISAVRSQIFKLEDKVVMLEKFFNAKISDSTLKQAYTIAPFSDIYLESLFYYSHELIRLDLYYQLYDYPPLLGLEQLHYVERRIQGLVGKQNEKSWEEVERSVEMKGGFSIHTWGTFITDYIADFGRLGTLVACFITGFLSGIFYRKFKVGETQMSVIRQSLICAGIVFSIQFSPFIELIWAFPLVMSSFIKVKLPTTCS